MSATNPATGWIYFVEAEGCDAVKIGWARNLDTRLRQLQCGAPCKLTFLLAFEVAAPREVERAIHARLRQTRLRGEWFSLTSSAELLDHIVGQYVVAQGVSIVESIPEEHVRAQLQRNVSWRNRNPEKAKAKERNRYARDPEGARARHNAWYAKNKEHARAYARAKKRERKNTDPAYVEQLKERARAWRQKRPATQQQKDERNAGKRAARAKKKQAQQ